MSAFGNGRSINTEPQISGIPVSKFGTHDALTARLDVLRAIGDRMQSEGSRLAAFTRGEYPDHRWDALPWEVAMALLELESAIGDWTEARKAEASPSSREREM